MIDLLFILCPQSAATIGSGKEITDKPPAFGGLDSGGFDR